jgi:predicted amidohydrolase YtcJ
MIDRILYNGKIYTQSNPNWVSAVAIRGEKIVAIGSSDEIRRLADIYTIQENLNGRLVIPGLVDAHLHWEWTARALQEVDLFEVPSLEVALERIAVRAKTIKPNDWLMGRGWAQGLWASLKFPTAQDVDPLVPNNPAYFAAKSGHAAWVNSVALRIAGIDAHTPDPEGGKIVRDENGQLTGVLLETAMQLVMRHIPNPTADDLADYMLEAQQLALSQGLTAFHDFDNPSALNAIQINRERGKHYLRVHKMINQSWIKRAIELGIRTNLGDDWLKIGSLKLFADGALGPKTALMVEPYIGEPDNYGIVVVPKDEMQEYASLASKNGIPTTIHAIGDKAVRDVLDVFEKVREEEKARGQKPEQMRHRIEHVQIIHPDDKYRLRDLKVIASMQPMHATSDWKVAEHYWGERCAWAYNIRWQLDNGVVCALGSDSPIEPFDPFKGLHAAVSRQKDEQPVGGWYPELRLNLEEAIYGFTVGAAYAAYMEDRQGRLAPQYYADLIILDRDIFALPADQLLQTKVLGTMVGGQWRFGGVQ